MRLSRRLTRGVFQTYYNQTELYGLFFKAVSGTLLELGADRKHLGAKLGASSILHTWGQNLSYHPHIHCIIPAGGLNGIGKWVNSRKKFFIPVKVLSAKFRDKFMALLRERFGKLKIPRGMQSIHSMPGGVDDFMRSLYTKHWVTYCKPPFKSPTCVLNYLGRYTHKIAISESRIISCKDGNVTFKWRDYKDGGKNKVMSLNATEFIRRFMMHVLPKGFSKIRHFGLLASRDKARRIALCQKLTKSRYSCHNTLSNHELLSTILGKDYNLCPECKTGKLSRASPSYPVRTRHQ